MMDSKVLVVGLGGVSCEICKNLILGGVGQVTLMDDRAVRSFLPFAARPPARSPLVPRAQATARDLSSNYFIQSDSLGTNVRDLPPQSAALFLPSARLTELPALQRAQASLASAAELNPFVKVDAIEGDVSAEGVEFFKQFKLVVVSSRSYAEQMKINDLCRIAGAMFVSCDVYGLCCYVFADLLDGYAYAE